MALEPGYERQVGGGTAVSLPNASAASFGADIGDNLQRLGGALERRHHVETQLAADQELADFNARSAAARAEADRWSTDARNNMQPGAAGHAKAAEDWWTARRDQLLTGITNGRVRRAAEHQLNEFGSRFGASEYQFEVGARVGKQTADMKKAIEVSANRARQLHDQQSYAEELSFQRQSIEALSVPADVKQGLNTLADQMISASFGNGVVDRDPRQMLALLDAGAFNEVLSPQQIEQLRNGSEVSINRLDVAAARAARDAAQIATNNEDAIKAQADDGVVVDAAALLSAADRAQAEGKADRAYQFRESAVKARVNNVYGNARADQIGERMGTIERMKDWRGRPDLVAEHGQLETLRTKMRNAEANYATGLNDADPASFAQRERDAVLDMQRRGLSVPQPLGPDDLARFQDLTKSGLKGQIAVADRLAQFSVPMAQAAARQVDPGNNLFMVATGLTPQSRALLLRGEVAGKTKPGQIVPTVVEQQSKRSIGGALARLPEDYQSGVRDAAEKIADAIMAERNADRLTDAIWDEATHRALGGTWARNGVKQGGMGEWNGSKVLLPYRMSQEDFDQRLSRITTLNGAFSSGGPVTADELRRFYTPVNVGGGYFHFIDRAGRAVKAKDGSNAAIKMTWNGK